jgi:hypothetical protein
MQWETRSVSAETAEGSIRSDSIRFDLLMSICSCVLVFEAHIITEYYPPNTPQNRRHRVDVQPLRHGS